MLHRLKKTLHSCVYLRSWASRRTDEGSGVTYNVRFALFLIDSEIRETMVRIMSVTKNSKRVADSFAFNQENEGSLWMSPEKFDLNEGLLSDDDSSASAPSTCAFWSAVALGALLAGQPTESVRHVSVKKCAVMVCL